MSRIISGLAGSIKLKAAAKATRPTSDRVKESLFAKLENLDALEGAKVLDLYAGSGALGLEAASRGAAEVILVDKDKAAIGIIRENIRIVSKAIGTSCLISAQNKEVSKVLNALASSYDLVFIDPPYELSNEAVAEDLSSLANSLSDEALVVVERSSRTTDFDSPEGYELEEKKTYGDTAVYLLRIVR
ncbi:MAG: rRNA ((966)-N(2))-methyltransferase RsmD [Actinomycetota bacterium]